MDALFHYTTAAGLLGILKSAKLWATDLRFLNDAQEFIYARDTVIRAIELMENPVLSPTHPAHEHGQGAIDTYAKYHQFVLEELESSEFGVYVTSSARVGTC